MQIIRRIRQLEPSSVSVDSVLGRIGELTAEIQDEELRQEFRRLLCILTNNLSIPVLGEVG